MANVGAKTSRLIGPNELADCLSWGLARLGAERAEAILRQVRGANLPEPRELPTVERESPEKTSTTVARSLPSGPQILAPQWIAAATFGPLGLYEVAIARRGAGAAATVVLFASELADGWFEHFAKVGNGRAAVSLGKGRGTATDNCPVFEPLVRRLRDQGMTYLQAFAPEDDDARRLERAGFRPIADLSIRVLESAGFGPAMETARRGWGERAARRLDADWEFVSLASLGASWPERLAVVLEATFRETLDCPRLSEVRTVDEIIHGYIESPRIDHASSSLLRVAGEDVGCLLLARHPRWSSESTQLTRLEVAYLGVVPWVRGQRWGWQLVAEAVRVARFTGVNQIVLAVDRANVPAITLYRAIGFRECDRDAAWGRRL